MLIALMVVAAACTAQTSPANEATKLQIASEAAELVKKFDRYCEELTKHKTYPKEPLYQLISLVEEHENNTTDSTKKNTANEQIQRAKDFLSTNNSPVSYVLLYWRHVDALLKHLDGIHPIMSEQSTLEMRIEESKQEKEAILRIIPIFHPSALPSDFFLVVFPASPCIPLQLGEKFYDSMGYSSFSNHDVGHAVEKIKTPLIDSQKEDKQQTKALMDHYRCVDLSCIKGSIYNDWKRFVGAVKDHHSKLLVDLTHEGVSDLDGSRVLYTIAPWIKKQSECTDGANESTELRFPTSVYNLHSGEPATARMIYFSPDGKFFIDNQGTVKFYD